MSRAKRNCAVAVCDQMAHFEIVWTNDRVYSVCTHHSDSVLERSGGLVPVAGELVTASIAGTTMGGAPRRRVRFTGSRDEAAVPADDRMSDAA